MNFKHLGAWLLVLGLVSAVPALAQSPSAPSDWAITFRNSCNQVRPVIPPSIQTDPYFRAAMVWLEVDVQRNGEPGVARILDSSGYPAIDAAVLEAAKQLRCKVPPDAPAELKIRQPFEFSLFDERPIPAGPLAAPAFVGRGVVRAARLDFQRALDDLDEALRQDPNQLDARRHRANVLRRMGRNEEAMAELDRLVARDPESARARRARAMMSAEAGDYSKAAADLQVAVRLEPDAGDQSQLGRMAFYSGNFALSSQALAAAINSGKSRAYDPLLLFISSSRLGQAGPAASELARSRGQMRDAWLQAIADFYLETLGADALMEQARSTEASVQKGRMCEVHFYVGQSHLVHGRLAPGLSELEAARRDCPATFIEYHAALEELKRQGRLPPDPMKPAYLTAAPACEPHPLPNEPLVGPSRDLRSGWVKFQMRLLPGAVPVADVRVLSESGGHRLARTYLPYVRRFVGCEWNKKERVVTRTFLFEPEASTPAKEGFGLYAFLPKYAPLSLPAGDFGIGVCPVVATLRLLQPAAANEVIELESGGGETVSRWLASLVPDDQYMVVSRDRNRVEIPCRVMGTEVLFPER